MLAAIKLLHTLIWAVLAGCILALPVLAWHKLFRSATIISVIVWIECAIVVLNGWRCPLTNWAALYTVDRAANFDIFLPLWLAANNKLVFGSLFLFGEMALASFWLRERGRSAEAFTRNKKGAAERQPF
jgi:hypothetical protein